MKKLIALLFILPAFANAQKDEGVKFIHRVTNWSDIVKQAQQEDKYIFIDCYTTWCGPCKYLSTQVFPKKNVGDFFNKNFVCISLQMDETTKDNDDAIVSRSIAESINEKYPITAYPTFLIFNKMGTLVHGFIGIGNDTFMIKKAKDALNENQQYYTLLEKYNNGNSDTIVLKNLINASNDVRFNADKYLLEYIKNIKDLYTEENGNLLLNNVRVSGSISFEILFSNREIWRNVVNKKKLEICLIRIIGFDIKRKYLKECNSRQIIQDKIISEYSKKYSEIGKKASLILILKCHYQKKNLESFKYILQFDEINADLFDNSNEINDYALFVFQNISDSSLLNKALLWSKKSLELDKDNPMYLDTYANLLYKLGQTKEAIEIETKALELVEEAKKKSYQEVLDKMKIGKPTW